MLFAVDSELQDLKHVLVVVCCLLFIRGCLVVVVLVCCYTSVACLFWWLVSVACSLSFVVVTTWSWVAV